MLEMSRESFFNYVKTLKCAMFSYVQGKDVERNGKTILSILKEFDFDIELNNLISVNTSIKYQDIDFYVDKLFFSDNGLIHKVNLS